MHEPTEVNGFIVWVNPIRDTPYTAGESMYIFVSYDFIDVHAQIVDIATGIA